MLHLLFYPVEIQVKNEVGNSGGGIKGKKACIPQLVKTKEKYPFRSRTVRLRIIKLIFLILSLNGGDKC